MIQRRDNAPFPWMGGPKQSAPYAITHKTAHAGDPP